MKTKRTFVAVSNPNIFLRAAKALSHRDLDITPGACDCLWRANRGHHGPANELFTALFHPTVEEIHNHGYWLAVWHDEYLYDLNQRHTRERRLFALLLAYEIAKDLKREAKKRAAK